MWHGKTDIKSLDYDELKDFFVSIGEKPFRAKQVYQWMHEKQADGFEEMTNLSKICGKNWQKPVNIPALRTYRRWFPNWTERENICSAFRTAMWSRVC